MITPHGANSEHFSHLEGINWPLTHDLPSQGSIETAHASRDAWNVPPFSRENFLSGVDNRRDRRFMAQYRLGWDCVCWTYLVFPERFSSEMLMMPQIRDQGLKSVN